MKQILFFVFALIAIGTCATGLSKKSSGAQYIQKAVSLLSQEGYTIDRVVELLRKIQIVEQKDLEALDNWWSEHQQILTTRVNDLESALGSKTAECNAIDDEIAQQQEIIETYERNIREAEETIQRNNAAVDEREAARCQATLLYIQRLKENQDALAFLHFLKGKIADPSFKEYLRRNHAAVGELKTHVGTNSTIGIGLLTKHQLLALLQQDDYVGLDRADLEATYNVNHRTDDEIGTGHIDNERDSLTRDSYSTTIRDIDLFISQLLSFLDQLIAETTQAITRLEDAEYASVQDLIAFKNEIELQNKVLIKYIAIWRNYVSQLSDVVKTNQEALSECRAGIPPLEKQLEDARDTLRSDTEDYQERRKSQENTISMLEKVINLYITKVIGENPEIYKKRVDDGLDDTIYDDTFKDFEHRKSSDDIDDWRNQEHDWKYGRLYPEGNNNNPGSPYGIPHPNNNDNGNNNDNTSPEPTPNPDNGNNPIEGNQSENDEDGDEYDDEDEEEHYDDDGIIIDTGYDEEDEDEDDDLLLGAREGNEIDGSIYSVSDARKK
mgnify:FL=1